MFMIESGTKSLSQKTRCNTCRRLKLVRTSSRLFGTFFVAVILMIPLMVALVGSPTALGESDVPEVAPSYLTCVTILGNGMVVGTDKVVFIGGVYRFTADIKGYVVVQKDNVAIDGAGFTLTGNGSQGALRPNQVNPTTGVNLVQTTSVAVRNLRIVNFIMGISPAANAVITGNYFANNQVGIAEPINADISGNYFENNEVGIRTASSSNKNNRIIGNTFANNRYGVKLMVPRRTEDVISGNTFTGNERTAISLIGCGSVTVSDNVITDTVPGSGGNITAFPMGWGIELTYAQHCVITGNYIAGNNYGLCFVSNATDNHFHHNDFINHQQIMLLYKNQGVSELNGLIETWDDGFEGNFWSDYKTRYPEAQEVAGTRVGDIPYEIDALNVDNYPLMAPANEPKPIEPSANVVLTGHPSLVGSQVIIEGTLSFQGAGVPFAPLQISYSMDEGNSWNYINTAETNGDGEYSTSWLPQERGTYEIQVTWEGNESIPQASITFFVVVAPGQENEQVSIASNSTITEFSFNTEAQTITFNVSGPSDTIGYVRLYVSKAVIQNLTSTHVYVDGAETSYSSSSTDDAWIIYITYSHSTHNVTVNLSQTSPEIPLALFLLVATGVLCGVWVAGFTLLFLRKRQTLTFLHNKN